MMVEPLTLTEVLANAKMLLHDNGVEESRRTAQLLLQHLLQMDTAELISRGNDILSVEQQILFEALVKRRLSPEPLQYITGKAHFWSHEFFVDQRVLIPRPESEHLLEEVIEHYPDNKAALKIADVGTGSGCLALSLAAHFPHSKVIALDIESGALQVAAINADLLNVTDRITFLEGDILSPLLDGKIAPELDVIVSNPPYVGLQESGSLSEVVLEEPHSALFSGTDGLDVFRRLIPQIGKALHDNGHFYLECGVEQSAQVEKLIALEPLLEHSRTVKDHQGIPRILVGKKRSV